MSDLSENIVPATVFLNLIADLVERAYEQTGVKITPENIEAYIAERKARREQLNAEMGITQE
ncbi:MAG: hypothetical protein HY911_04430 [Desulfobacterales bacterium]|nr:hypothetical protein [Desulfobacterales bacterium]